MDFKFWTWNKTQFFVFIAFLLNSYMCLFATTVEGVSSKGVLVTGKGYSNIFHILIFLATIDLALVVYGKITNNITPKYFLIIFLLIINFIYRIFYYFKTDIPMKYEYLLIPTMLLLFFTVYIDTKTYKYEYEDEEDNILN